MVIDRLVRIKEVLHIVGCGKTKLYDLIQAGKFPKPVKIGNTVVWPESEINVWVSMVLASRDQFQVGQRPPGGNGCGR